MSDDVGKWLDLEEAVSTKPPSKSFDVCPRCNEGFGPSDLRLVTEDQADSHYVYCPKDRWKPVTWEEYLATAAVV
jgi:hypothetical protein